MLKVSLRGNDVGLKAALGLSANDLRRLREGLFLRTNMEELLPEWKGDLWVVSQEAMFKEVRDLAAANQAQYRRDQIVLGLDKTAFEKLEAVPRKAVAITMQDPWKGTIYFFRGETEADMLEEWAPLLGPESRIMIDRV